MFTSRPDFDKVGLGRIDLSEADCTIVRLWSSQSCHLNASIPVPQCGSSLRFTSLFFALGSIKPGLLFPRRCVHHKARQLRASPLESPAEKLVREEPDVWDVLWPITWWWLEGSRHDWVGKVGITVLGLPMPASSSASSVRRGNPSITIIGSFPQEGRRAKLCGKFVDTLLPTSYRRKQLGTSRQTPDLQISRTWPPA